MYLKTLTLKGFKSFADPTTLALEPGVTVVVGPNGSGKSNVVDAIGWVLGAQAPSTVRSQKMDDVIFAGTTRRTALGRAEVSLCIDNASGILPIEFSEVTITRTLFRTGESEYAINGSPCRLLDIQELLSDSGVGRHLHVIVSQGHIDAVLNAKPEDRRAVIEEAAGVLKYRKRKEKSERRLAATETNLTRLQDLLREVRRQLRPLEKQADAARRHGAVVAELTALRIFLAGRELTSLRTRIETVAQSRAQHQATEAELRKLLRELDAQIVATEARMSALGGTDLGDDLAAFESLAARAQGLGALIAERARGVEQARGAFIDQAVIATLEAESAGVRVELADVEAEAKALGPASVELEAAEAALADRRAAFEVDWAEGVAAPSGEAAEVRGELAALRAALERGRAEAERVRSRLTATGERAARLGDEAARLRRDLAAAEGTELPLVESLDGAERARAAAEEAVTRTTEALQQAQADRNRWQARVEALDLALDEARSRAGLERLHAVDGVVGTVVDLVEVDDGWAPAFEAAAGEALTAVVVDGPDRARAALATLAEESLAGAVLALGTAPVAATPPSSGQPVRAHVRPRPGHGDPAGLDALLDALVGGAVCVEGGWPEAVDVSLAHPGAVVVTPDGGRFGPDGWRLGAQGSGATGAALDEARHAAADAEAEVERAARRRDEARATLEDARRAEGELSRQLDDNDGRLAAAGDGLQRVESERRDAESSAEGLRSRLAELEERAAQEAARVAELDEVLPRLEAGELETQARGRALGSARAELEEHAASVGAMRTDLEVRTAGVAERRQFLERRLAELDERLERHAAEREEAARRRVELDAALVTLDRLGAMVTERRTEVDAVLADLRERRREQSEVVRAVAAELDGLRRERSAKEKDLAAARELLQRAEVDDAEVRLRIETAVEAVRRDLDTEPDAAMAAPPPELAEGVSAAARVRELERDLRIMGPINPLALEEFQALQERHTFLQEQLDDVKESRRELAKIIKAIDEEIVQVFAAAFADVSQNFTQLFETLFPGGQGRLRLTEADNLLETGIEVEAKPSGKNVRKLSLLSGGERSLTALAYLFAVFRSRPSPFYVMDEVEAALDDVNLHRFLGLVEEFRQEAQLLIVSHQKRTMEAADVLYGVTMQPGGSSKVVSEKVDA